MLEPAFITLQAIMNKAAEMMEHYQTIAPRVFRQCCACLDTAQQTSPYGHSARLKCLTSRANMHWEQENEL